MKYMLMMSTRKYMPESVKIKNGRFDALIRHVERSVREPNLATIFIEAMTDQLDVYLNDRKIAVYMAGA